MTLALQTVPRERQPDLVPVGSGVARRGAHHRRVQGRVQQRGVDTEPGRFLAVFLGERDLGEGFLAAPPHRAHGLEGRAVAVSHVREHLVATADVDRLCVGRRPGGEVEAAAVRTTRGRQHTRCVPGPGVRVFALGVHLHRARAALAGSAQRDLHADPAAPRNHERCLDHQLVKHRATGFVTGPHGQLDQSGTGDDDDVPHGVVGQPGVGPQGQP